MPKVFAISMEPINLDDWDSDDDELPIMRKKLKAIETVFEEFKENFFALARGKDAVA